MRCLTLADALAEKGALCLFVCRPHVGHLLELISQRGHLFIPLKTSELDFENSTNLDHYTWLGASWIEDAEQTIHFLAGDKLDWIVVDHYSLDYKWEQAVRKITRRIMVIDDLADRSHDCDLLLDQTFGRSTNDYSDLVSVECRLLCGAQYALLRPEFAVLRNYSLMRRTKPKLKELLINLGGVDKDNLTGKVLHALSACTLPLDCRLTVVMGLTAPWLNQVKKIVDNMHQLARVLVGVNDMAQLMADSDLAIGAGGSTSWERCCLGLPSIVILTAENQRLIISNLTKANAIISLESILIENKLGTLVSICNSNDVMFNLTKNSSYICDGLGTNKVIDLMYV